MTELGNAMAKLRPAFIARLDRDAERLERSSACADWAEVVAISHDLAGAAGLFGFSEIGELAARLEESASVGATGTDASALQEALLTKMRGVTFDT